MSDDTMRCHACGEDHADWERDGEYAVRGRYHSGIVARWRCGRCGAMTEGERR